MKIAIDAGHGLYTAGKRCMQTLDPTETREWTLNNRIATQVCNLLATAGHQTLRLDDPTGANDVPLSTRSRTANNADADFCVSIHHDSGVAGSASGGMTVFVYSGGASAQSRALQKAVYRQTVQRTNLAGNRAEPLRSANFHMVRAPKMPAILIECGFMDSATDVPIILSEAFATQCAQGIATGICEVAGGSIVSTTVTTAVPQQDCPAWAREACDWAVEQGYFSGDGKGNFNWNAGLTRAQLAQVLFNGYHTSSEAPMTQD